MLQFLLIGNTPAEEAPERKWLESILSWPLWKHYFRHASTQKFLYMYSDRPQLPYLGDLFSASSSSSVVDRTLELATRVFSRYALDLARGEIAVTDFELVETNKDRFLDICGALDKAKRVKDSLKHNSALAIKERSQEWRRFKEEKNLVINFVNICQTLGNGKTFSITNKIRLPFQSLTSSAFFYF